VKEFIGGPLYGGRVSLAFWVLDQIESPISYDDTSITYVCYDLDPNTDNYIYKGEKTMKRGRLNDRENPAN